MRFHTLTHSRPASARVGLPHGRSASASREGFALIIAISLMAFILLLLLSLTSMVQIELSSSQQNLTLQLARENARFGMITALGQLQKQAGHDRRITATSATAGYHSASAPDWVGPTDVSGFEVAREKSHYVGVWNTETNEMGGWLISDNPDQVAIDLEDLSEDSDIQVSVVGGQLINNDEANTAILVGGGSVDLTVDEGARDGGAANGKPDDIIVAEKVPVQQDQAGDLVSNGNFAYWIGDEGGKAKITVADNTDAAVALQSQYVGNYLRFIQPQKAGVSALSGAFDPAVDLSGYADGDPAFVDRILSLRTLPMADTNYELASKRLFHDVTTHSYGVISDTKHGSLRKDLSNALVSGNQPQTMLGQLGATEDALIFDPMAYNSGAGEVVSTSATIENPGGPRWDQLKDWYQLRPNGGGNLDIRQQTDSQHGIAPMLVGSRMWFYAGLVQETTGVPPAESHTYRFRYFFWPTVVLANPYSHDLEISQNLYFRFEYNSAPRLKAQLVDAAGNPWSAGGATAPEVTMDMPLYSSTPGGRATQHADDRGVMAYVFTITPTTIPAGETIVFTPQNGNRPLEFVNDQGRRLDVDGSDLGPLTGAAINVLDANYEPIGSGFYFDNEDHNGGLDESLALSASISDDYSTTAAAGLPYVRLWQTHDTNGIHYALATSETFDGNSLLTVVHRTQNWGFQHEKPWVGGFGDALALTQVITNDAARVNTLGGNFPAYGYLMALRMSANSMTNPTSIDENIDLPMRWLAQYNPRAPILASSPEEYDLAINAGYNWQDHKGVTRHKPGDNKHARGSYFGCPNTIAKYYPPSAANAWSVMPVIGNRMRWGHSDTIAEGFDKVVLFEVPSDDWPISSIGQLMQVNWSRGDSFQRYRRAPQAWTAFWQYSEDINSGGDQTGRYLYNNINPAYAVGNSWADHTIPNVNTYINWENKYSNGSLPTRDGHHYDYSYHLNNALWDRFYFSTVSQTGGTDFPQINARLVSYAGEDGVEPTSSDLQDFYTPAAHMLIDGAFNIHSASPQAWKVLIGSILGTNNTQVIDSAYARIVGTPGSSFELDAHGVEDPEAYYGYRLIKNDLPASPPTLDASSEMSNLAWKIVEHVTSRVGIDGPFNSLGAFVNRNPDSDYEPHRIRGVLQAAIDWDLNTLPTAVDGSGAGTNPVSVLNENLNKPFYDENNISMTSFSSLTAPVALELNNVVEQPTSQAVPGYLTQADLLARLGSALSTRSDTFRIRAYGDFTNPVTEEVEAQAWCEAIVQRLPEYVDASIPAVTPSDDTTAGALGMGSQSTVNEEFGRRFKIVGFRWLNKEDV